MRRRQAALTVLVALATELACILNPQPIPPDLEADQADASGRGDAALVNEEDVGALDASGAVADGPFKTIDADVDTGPEADASADADDAG